MTYEEVIARRADRHAGSEWKRMQLETEERAVSGLVEHFGFSREVASKIYCEFDKIEPYIRAERNRGMYILAIRQEGIEQGCREQLERIASNITREKAISLDEARALCCEIFADI